MTLDVPRQADRTQSADAIPVQIEFIPNNPVARRLRNSVMIVVPSFAEGQQCDPKTVFRSVVSKESPRTPHVCRGVYQPGGMQPEHSSHEHAPQKKRPAANRKQCN